MCIEIESGTLMTMEEVLRDVLPVHFHAQLTFLALSQKSGRRVAHNYRDCRTIF